MCIYFFCAMDNKIKFVIRLFLLVVVLEQFSFGADAQKLKPGKTLKGIASFYAHKFNGRKTANGEIFDNAAYTCAHKNLPFGTLLEVENIKNGKKVVVRVNDRGPYFEGRELDLSLKAAKELGIVLKGHSEVKITRIEGVKPLGPLREETEEELYYSSFFKLDSSNIVQSIFAEGTPKKVSIMTYQ